MQCLKRCAGALALTAAALALALALGATLAPRWLNDPDPPEKAAAILVLGGDPSRALQAAELFRAGYAPTVYITVPVRDPLWRRLDELGITLPSEEELTRKVLAVGGVPDGAVQLLGRNVASTAQEAALARERLAGSAGPLIVVTSPYHVRRARMILRDALHGAPRLVLIANRHEPLPDAWWKDQAAARNVVLETVKTLYYLAGGHF
jgi:uncharacterized SAM-binding protein YcdF (DUF218 family)